MQFTRLRLLGFKSFVDPTELVIAPGLTGVVGPNGCGKSNLLEALRWVMGENRPSAMRGGGMEDVIFAGAATRPARNYAEVTLHLDNSQRLAPAGFNDADNLEIVRRITRDAGSAYKANGKEARARDIQMLFADASTGAHSPALVRQGQISELINAKPKARRRILEEAAGISGLYQRRHEAELKLRATESNLERVDDVLEALRNQLAQLERQARQAARYREIGTALRQAEGLLLFLRWQEAEAERLSASAALTEAVKIAAAAQGEAARAARAREAAAEAMPPLREEEAVSGAILQRQLIARDALDEREARAREEVRSLTARIEQLTRDAERERGLNRDAGERIAELDWEGKAIATASEGQEARLEEARDAAREAGERLKSEEAALDRMTEDTARLSARHQSAERRLADARAQAGRAARELAEAVAAEERLAEEQAEAAARRAAADDALEDAREEAERTEGALGEAEAARAEAQAAEAAARGLRAEAEGEASALGAELAALRRLIERESGEGPQILDRVRAAPGYEAALGAALGDDLKAPELDGDAAGSGWRALDAGMVAAGLPEGAAALSAHVSAPGVLARRLAHVGLVERADGARLQARLAPGQRLVSREGDLWRWDGFVSAAEDTPSAAALRLQQLNRLAALEEAAAEAGARQDAARAEHDAARGALELAQAAEAAARRARKAAEDAASAALREAGRAESAETTLTGRLETVRMGKVRREEELAAAEDEIATADAAMAELGDLEEARAALDAARAAVEAARGEMMARRARMDDLKREADQRTRRAQEIAKEISGWKHRLATAEARIAELEERIADGRDRLEEAAAVPDAILEERARLVELVLQAEERCRKAADALAEGETALRAAEAAERAAERAASEAREVRARAEGLAEAAAERAEAAADRIMEEREQTPEALLDALGTDAADMPEAEATEIEVQRLRRQREALGAVNLRAEEDAREVQTEFDTLAAEKADLEEAVGKLRHGIANLNREGRQRLLAAFDEVNANFATLFRTLFGGGDANLVLVESDDPLEAGLEIMCQPPGKKLSTLSLLSGGEQTLTALSLIFAVFLANPAPICVLDEVDAPLDDANVTRFCDLLDEMIKRTETRFLIITHHAVTMSRMDRLFGVTMVEQGVSQLVSVDLARAEALVEA
ncbi:chromosome segregation protein SMC [Halovulum dunhuangense]|uniref:Chromosome partition protein Smc n=1 Tax=Halovulum dunhuangense TaxID=1505036 RepID=A0A849KR53_9RHOB|nr:chromosome segregation protein SMC [Halovulum dunhuangense]NNU79553.1 chromosome segregation protein SMC [Halovulum dunhuangense]